MSRLDAVLAAGLARPPPVAPVATEENRAFAREAREALLKTRALNALQDPPAVGAHGCGKTHEASQRDGGCSEHAKRDDARFAVMDFRIQQLEAQVQHLLAARPPHYWGVEPWGSASRR